MPRANSSVPRHRRHRKIVKQAKGYYGARSRTYKSAKDAVTKAGLYAYRDRRQRKRMFRRLWITRINAACRLNGTTYSAFIRVAQPNDGNEYYMDLNVNSVIPYFIENDLWIDPIDTLQILYNEWYETSFDYELGDVNQDLIIDILDIVIIINTILGEQISGTQFYLADINSDNILNIQDIILIINIILP